MTSAILSAQTQIARRASAMGAVATAYIATCIFYIYSYAAIFFTDYGVRASYFYYATWLVGCLFFLSSVLSGKWRALPKWHLFTLTGFLLLLIAQAIFTGGSIVTNFSYIAKIYFIFTTIGIYFILNYTEDWRQLRAALTIVVVFSCALNFVELFRSGLLPHRLSTTAGRAAGLYRNPNQAALFIAAAAPLICVGIARPIGIFLLGTTMVGVLLTFSRSGLLCWIVAAGFTLAMMRRRSLGRDQATGAVVGMLLFGALIWVFHQPLLEFLADLLGPILNQDTADRLRGQLNDQSAQERLYLQQYGWKVFLTAPVFGKGIGYTFFWDLSVSTHNTYLLFLVETGVVGACWLAIFFLSFLEFQGAYGLALLCIFLVLSFFSHSIFDEPSYGLLMALFWRASQAQANSHASAPSPAPTS